MDRHKTMERYIALKERVFMNCGEDDFVVLNYDDPITKDMASRVRGRVVWFSSRNPVPYGAFVSDGKVVFGEADAFEPVCEVEEIAMPGERNLKNALAATAMASVCGVPTPVIRHTLRTFQGVEHRIEFVRELDGVRFINDSKGTNVDSTIQAVRAMRKPTVLILGGYDKHCDFTPLVEEIKKCPISHIVLIGATAEQISQTLDRCGYPAYERCGTDFEAAVRRAFELAEAEATSSCRPAARASTCSATTRSAAGCSRRSSGSWRGAGLDPTALLGAKERERGNRIAAERGKDENRLTVVEGSHETLNKVHKNTELSRNSVC